MQSKPNNFDYVHKQRSIPPQYRIQRILADDHPCGDETGDECRDDEQENALEGLPQRSDEDTVGEWEVYRIGNEIGHEEAIDDSKPYNGAENCIKDGLKYVRDFDNVPINANTFEDTDKFAARDRVDEYYDENGDSRDDESDGAKCRT